MLSGFISSLKPITPATPLPKLTTTLVLPCADNLFTTSSASAVSAAASSEEAERAEKERERQAEQERIREKELENERDRERQAARQKSAKPATKPGNRHGAWFDYLVNVVAPYDQKK